MVLGSLLAAPAPANVAVYTAILAGMMAIVLFSFLLLVLRWYKRCPSNRILVVYGKVPGGLFRCIHGGAVFVVPLLQDFAYLDLDPIRVDISRRVRSTGRDRHALLPQIVTVAIGTTPELMQAAAMRLLGLSQDQMRQLAEDTILGQLDRPLDPARAAEEKPDASAFHATFETDLRAELAKLGLELVNFRSREAR